MLTVNLERLLADLEAFSEIGRDEHGGVTRLAFSPADQPARRLLHHRLRPAGLRVRGIPFLELPSGAGQDAVYLAEIAETGMIFVRCRAGISRNPVESVEPQDAGAGAAVLAETALRLADE